MTTRLGSLCTGYGGLDTAVQAVFGGETVWVADVDKGANKIIAHRYPNVPNIGDIATAAWDQLEPVDILTAGYPCQPFSHAGQRKGTNDERHLWPYVREAVRVLRPRLTVLENVAGHRSLGFDRVLGDLAEDGLHVWWTSIRASDIGAPHRRERLFIFATPDTSGPGTRRNGGTVPSSLEEVGRTDLQLPATLHGSLLPTPRATDGSKGGPNQRGSSGDLMLPSAVALLPTSAVADIEGGRRTRSGSRNTELLLNGIAAEDRWADYAPAITHWERILGRAAPAPTQASSKGNPQLSPAFVEWLMGLPEGHVTDVPGITRNEALKALGNGVVPQQAEAAIRWLLTRAEVAA